MNRQPGFFEECTNFKVAILLYQSWLERKNFVNLKKTQLLYLVNKFTKPYEKPKAYQRLVRDEKLREGSVPCFFVLIITLMLWRNISEAFMSISKKHNHKTFTRNPPASLLHCIENILNRSSGKCRDSLIMAALIFTKSTGLGTIFIHKYLLSNICFKLVHFRKSRVVCHQWVLKF